MTVFWIEPRDIYEASERRIREQMAKKRAEQLVFLKGCFVDVRASLRRTCVLVQCASRAVNSRQRGYLKIDENCNFEEGPWEGHTSEDRRWVRSGEIQVSRGVSILFKDPAVGACLGCRRRPVCIPAERL